jgi:hypothetical protein
MAFALSKAYFYKVDTPSHIRKWGFQAAEFHITRTSSDTDLDLGDVSGTFWTAVGASGIGAVALPLWRSVLPNFEELAGLQLTSDSGFLVQSPGDAYLSATGSHTAVWAGGTAGTALNANSPNQTIRYQHDGEFVTLQIPGYQAAAKGASPGAVIILTGATVLPAALRPTADVVVRTRKMNNGSFVSGAGMAIIKTTGQIEMYLDGVGTTAYTVTANIGFDSFATEYRVGAAPVSAGTFQLVNGDTYPVIEPNIVLPAAAPTTLRVFMLVGLKPETRPVEFGV